MLLPHKYFLGESVHIQGKESFFLLNYRLQYSLSDQYSNRKKGLKSGKLRTSMFAESKTFLVSVAVSSEISIKFLSTGN